MAARGNSHALHAHAMGLFVCVVLALLCVGVGATSNENEMEMDTGYKLLDLTEFIDVGLGTEATKLSQWAAKEISDDVQRMQKARENADKAFSAGKNLAREKDLGYRELFTAVRILHSSDIYLTCQH